MLLLFSPFSFLFLCLYLLVISALISVSDFLYFWLLIEFLMLLFIGVSYTIFTNNISSLIVYFFVQSFSSFAILISYFLSSAELFSLSLFLNLGMFPFIAWYISSLNFFPPLLFFVASTLQKLPAIFMLLNTSVVLSAYLFWVSAVGSALFGGVLMLAAQSVRFLLVASSVCNNSWLLLAAQSNSLCLSLFLTVYFLLVFIVLSALKQFSDIVARNSQSAYFALFTLCSLSGVPPSPLFLGNALVTLSLLELSSTAWPLLIFLALSVASSSAYICFSMKLFVSSFRV